MTVLPSVTWPSPANATTPLRRTPRMVVPCGSNRCESVIQSSRLWAQSAASCRVARPIVGLVPSGPTLRVVQNRSRRFCARARPIGLCDLAAQGAARAAYWLAFVRQALDLAPRAGVRGVVNAGEVLEVKVGVDLGRGDVGMPQQFLYPAQLGAGLEQVRGEGMAEKMRIDMGGEALAARPVRDPQLDRPPPEAPPGAADEERLLLRSREVRALGEPLLEGANGHAAHRHPARLASLAEHIDHAVAQIETRRVEPHDLRQPQS